MFFQHEFSFYRSLTDVLDQECFDGLKDIVPEVIERRATILLPSLPLANFHHLEDIFVTDFNLSYFSLCFS